LFINQEIKHFQELLDMPDDIRKLITEMGKRARHAAATLATLKPSLKNNALLAMADDISSKRGKIQSENQKDLDAGKKAGLSSAVLDRLLLNDKRIHGMCEALTSVASLDDPVGEVYDMHTRPNGLRVGRMRCPIGVIGIIYESRPNVTSDAAGLCVKSGNAVILRGGKEAINSNKAIAAIMNDAGLRSGLPPCCIQLVPTTERQAVKEMLRLNEFIDLIIPRGGKSLIETVVNNSTIPVIKHYDGNCYIYVDEEADLTMALEIVINAKTQRPGVCNALESLLVHQAVAENFLKKLIPKLKEKNVEIRACKKTNSLISGLKTASDLDWRTEYLDLILSIKITDSLENATDFINANGSHHTDAIVTQNYEKALRFLNSIDSATVLINASTRFSDGGEFGMGCEIGISTDKLHARGPMGLRELTTYKFIVLGEGQIRT
jgi:glutamate-5-semialdehyde dehydrogenase